MIHINLILLKAVSVSLCSLRRGLWPLSELADVNHLILYSQSAVDAAQVRAWLKMR